MRGGWVTLLAAAGCLTGALPATSMRRPVDEPVDEPVIRYPRTGAGILRYAFGRQDTITATMPSGEAQVQVIGRTAYLTLTWIAADTGTRITAAIDSFIPGDGMARFSPSLDSAFGARWTALRANDGHLTALSGGPASSLADQVRDDLRLLFPPLPENGAWPGLSWHDSLSAPARVSAFDATETALTSSEADSTIPPGDGLTVHAVRIRTASGQGMQYQQPITVTATGTDSLLYELGADAQVLRVEGRRVTDLVLDLPAVGQRVSARESSILRMTLLP